MDLGLTPLERNVAKQAQHLDLLVDRHTLVILAFPVEIAEDDFAESADRAEAACGQAVVRGEPLQACHRLFARVEDHSPGALSGFAQCL